MSDSSGSYPYSGIRYSILLLFSSFHVARTCASPGAAFSRRNASASGPPNNMILSGDPRIKKCFEVSPLNPQQHTFAGDSLSTLFAAFLLAEWWNYFVLVSLHNGLVYQVRQCWKVGSFENLNPYAQNISERLLLKSFLFDPEARTACRDSELAAFTNKQGVILQSFVS